MIGKNQDHDLTPKAFVESHDAPQFESKTLSPREEYNQAVSKRKHRVSFLVALVIVIECAAGGFLFYQNDQYSFQDRVLYELEMRNSGSIDFGTSTYTGGTDFGYLTGDGTLTFSTGTVYDGEFLDNQMSGKGVLRVPISGIYDGEFKNSQKSGTGTYTWDDGDYYSGEWKEDKMCGQGTYKSADGVLYDGTFSDNKFVEGRCTFGNATGTYSLEFKGGTIHSSVIDFSDGTKYTGECSTTGLAGNGKMTFPNEDIYDGDFSEGLRNGKGVYSWGSGDRYDGQWSSDEMHGTGTYTYSNGSIATGTFSHNGFTEGSYKMKTSFGSYTFGVKNGVIVTVDMSLSDGTTYTGDMVNGELSGHAQIKYSNGDTYSGKVDKGAKSGQGRYVWKSGASYDGSWKEDRMSGTGTYVYPANENGYKLTGTFENGRPNGQCTYYSSATQSFKTDWVNGNCVKVYE